MGLVYLFPFVPLPVFWKFISAPVVWMYVLSHSVVSDSATLWTVAHPAPLSMEIFRQEYQNWLPFLPPGEFKYYHYQKKFIYSTALALIQDLLLWCAGSLAVALGLSGPSACGILVPGPGTEPVSPALQGRLLTTGPPGKSLIATFIIR